MKIRITRPIVSVHGTYQPEQVTNQPDEVARVWLQKGVAVAITKPPKEGKPDVIPKGMFWCSRCQSFHRLVSPRGVSHRKYLVE